MTGMTLAGVRVESPRRRAMASRHPLGTATDAETRSTFITTLKATGRTMDEIARIMRCSTRTLHKDLGTPPISVGMEEGRDDD